MTPIRDYLHYDEEMSKGMLDKLFFMDKVDATVFLDYGCADGALFEHINRMFPGSKFEYFGYDIDPKMIAAAEAKNIPDSMFSTELDILMDWVKLAQKSGQKVCLVLSSVVHEVYSYCTEDQIKEFWEFVNNSGFDYIALRDIICPDLDYGDTRENLERAILRYADPKQLEDFQKIWGKFYQGSNAAHFLLKYRYTQNWEREVRENYFALEPFDFYCEVDRQKYDIDLEQTFVHPFISQQIKKDFNVDFNVETHIKMIWAKDPYYWNKNEN